MHDEGGHAGAAPRAFIVDGERLTLADVVAVARGGARAELAPAAVAAMEASRALVERIIDRGDTIYGINTGFGDLSNVRIPPAELEHLQRNLLRSHAAGVGPPLPEDAARAMLLLRANALAKGYSGARPVVAERLLDLLNAGVTPVIPAQGSVGASGDLAPLAHMSLVLIGEGRAVVDGEELPGGEALRRRDLAPLTLAAKEGLALINGTQEMTALGALALHDAEILAETAEVAAATSVEALRGTDAPFDAAIQAVRPHPGQARVAARLRALLGGSEILPSHKDPASDPRVQDPYSLRCTPQVLGASWDALGYVRGVLEIEINSATDNPLCFPESGRVLSGGNFHGQPVAIALDLLKIAVAEIADISERRTYLLLDPARSGLPAFLAANPGLDSGFMAAQYSAAALVSENKVLAHPASVDSVPTSAGMEDHVSMGPIAARGAAQIVENVARVLAIELLCAAEGVGRQPLRPGRGVVECVARVRAVAPPLTADRPPADDIARLTERIRDGAFRLEEYR
ncbi:MAG TPA: histidine ammonia-lyase [Thermomicrobiales bacterium]|nr:histidine ammonia-lyase [Thermomicrobiales bacterium]